MKKITLLSLVLLLFTSCGGVGLIAGGKTTIFEGEYVLESKGSIEKSKSKLKSVLSADGWNKTKEDRNIISFQNASSYGSIGLIGKNNSSTIIAKFTDENVGLTIRQIGNFKAGTEKEVNKLFMKIKEQYELN
jgi:hypothetical protein